MRTTYDPSLKANVIRDDAGRIRGINHLDEYRAIEQRRDRGAAATYVRQMAGVLAITPEALRDLELPLSYLDPQAQDLGYRSSEEKPQFDTVTYGFAQTWLNIPVWAAGITVTLKRAPARVVAASDTSAQDIDAKLPSQKAIERYRAVLLTGEKTPGRAARATAAAAATGAATAAASELVTSLLGTRLASGKQPRGRTAKAARRVGTRLIRGRFYVYRYDQDARVEDHAEHAGKAGDGETPLCGTPPVLPLPPVPKSIVDGRWYVVAELIVGLQQDGHRMNWRLLVDIESDTVLYARALTSGVNGLVFTYDPITSTGTATNTPDQSNAVLNPHRDDVTLPNLDAPVGGTQALQGSLVTLTDLEPATDAPPTRPTGSDFDYNVRTNDFAAVNAYYHNDRFFQLVADLGFPLATYFDGTAFPVEVDHRGKGTAANDGDTINAHCVGDGDGIDHACYALADLGDTANPIGIASDWRVVLHELGGHGILHDHVGGPNFGFAHSAGDSFAMILNDYVSEWHNGAAIDRFVLAPFVPEVVRRSDRSVASGWGWGGTNDVGGYPSEEILSTTLFRAYRAIGGDSTSFNRREFSARCLSYLILRAVGTLTPASNPGSPAEFLSALIAADAGNWTSEGVFGGAYGKVLTWAFEKQDLDGGAPPTVDVYIDDGRAGEYQYLPAHWGTTTIWNRRDADGMTGHQEPALGETNYAYVKIKNRGTAVANDVVVKGFHCKPSAGVLWPNDLQPMTTAQLSAGTLQPNNAEEKIVGPFAWTPVENTWGHDCMLMIVSAAGDPSNVDNFTAGEVVEDWRLVPNDNNVGQRNVTLVPGGGGIQGFMAGLHGKGFFIGNPGRTPATVTVDIALPPLLARRGWRVALHDLPAAGVRLKPNEQRLVTFAVHAGTPFSKAEAAAESMRDIVVTATADGAIVGGMVYHIDPEIERPYNDKAPGDGQAGCCTQAQRLLDCLDLGGGKVKHVQVRKVAIDIEMAERDCGGCG